MNGWSEALRQELQPDIRVTVIEPGAVATELTNHTTDPAAKQGADQLYAELAITPDDVAEVIAFAVTRPRRMTLNEILLRPTNPTLAESRLAVSGTPPPPRRARPAQAVPPGARRSAAAHSRGGRAPRQPPTRPAGHA